MSAEFIQLKINLTQGPSGPPGTNGSSSVINLFSGSVNSIGSVASGTFSINSSSNLLLATGSTIQFQSGSRSSGSIVPNEPGVFNIGAPGLYFSQSWVQDLWLVSGNESVSLGKVDLDRLYRAIPSESYGTLDSLYVSSSFTASSATGAFHGLHTGDGTQLTLPFTSASYLRGVKIDSASFSDPTDQYIIRYSQAENAFIVSSENVVTFDTITGLPNGILSSSGQIASDISGAFNDVSQAIALDISSVTAFPYTGSAIILGDLQVTQSSNLPAISLYNSTQSGQFSASFGIVPDSNFGAGLVIDHTGGSGPEDSRHIKLITNDASLRLSRGAVTVNEGVFSAKGLANFSDVVTMESDVTFSRADSNYLFEGTSNFDGDVLTNASFIAERADIKGNLRVTQSGHEDVGIRLFHSGYTNGVASGRIFMQSSSNTLGLDMHINASCDGPQPAQLLLGIEGTQSMVIQDAVVSISENVSVFNVANTMQTQGAFYQLSNQSVAFISASLTASNVIPRYDDRFTLGTTTQRFKEVHATSVYAGALNEYNLESDLVYDYGTLLVWDVKEQKLYPSTGVPEIPLGVANGVDKHPMVYGAEEVKMTGSWEPFEYVIAGPDGKGFAVPRNIWIQNWQGMSIGLTLTSGSSDIDEMAFIMINRQ